MHLFEGTAAAVPAAATWGLLLVPASALLKRTAAGDSLPLALLKAAGVSLLAWLLIWGAFRYGVTQGRSKLAELLLLQTVAPA